MSRTVESRRLPLDHLTLKAQVHFQLTQLPSQGRSIYLIGSYTPGAMTIYDLNISQVE